MIIVLANSLSRSTPLPKTAETAQDFESMFLGQMLAPMFEGISTSPLGGSEESSAGDIYRSWLTDQFGKLMAQHGGIGVADMVKKEMLRLQEVTS